MEGIIDKTGQLVEKLKPAVYLDTSVLVEYTILEGVEYEEHFEELSEISEANEPPHYQTIRDLLRSDKHTETLVAIRKK